MAEYPALDHLRRWLDTTGTTQRALSGRLGVGESTIWAWLQGTRRPSHEVAAALERVTEGYVPASSWADPERVDELLSRSNPRH